MMALERRSHTGLGHDSTPMGRCTIFALLQTRPRVPGIAVGPPAHRRPPWNIPEPGGRGRAQGASPRHNRIGRISARMMRSPQPEASPDGPWSPGARARLRPSGATESCFRGRIDRHRVPPGRHHSGRHAHPARALDRHGRPRAPTRWNGTRPRWGRWAGNVPTDVRTAARSIATTPRDTAEAGGRVHAVHSSSPAGCASPPVLTIQPLSALPRTTLADSVGETVVDRSAQALQPGTPGSAFPGSLHAGTPGRARTAAACTSACAPTRIPASMAERACSSVKVGFEGLSGWRPHRPRRRSPAVHRRLHGHAARRSIRGDPCLNYHPPSTQQTMLPIPPAAQAGGIQARAMPDAG